MLTYKSMTKSDKKDAEQLELLTIQEASDLLNVHPNTLRQWDRKGILKAIRFGERRDRRYKKEEVMRLVNNN